MKENVQLPLNGVANNSTLFDTPGSVCAPARMRNLRAYDTHLDRPRLGQRPGLVRSFSERVGPGIGQGCGVVSRAKVATGYTYGNSVSMTDQWVSRTSDEISGHLWGLTPDLGLAMDYTEDVSGSGPYSDSGPSDQSVAAIAVSPDGTKAAIASNYVDGSGYLVTRITCVTVSTGARVWSTKVTGSGANKYTDALAFSSDWVFAASKDAVEAFAVSDGTRATPFTSGWAAHFVGLALTTDGHVYAAFRGASAGATLPSGVTVSAGKYASHFRSGVMKLKINPAGSSSALSYVPFSSQLASNARYYDGPSSPYTPHDYCRFSEKFPWAPRGCLPSGIAYSPDGGFYVAHTNTGWGPDSNNASQDYAAPIGPYTTLSRFDSSGEFLWSVDTFSDTSTGDGGFPNDIPTTGTDETTLNALASDNSGFVVCGGKRLSTPAGTNSLYGVSSSGVLMWTRDTGSIVRQGGIAFVPGTQGWVAACGDRNTNWGSGANAHLWRIDRDTGVIQKGYDTGKAGSALGVAFTPGGLLMYVSDKIS